MYSLNAHPNNWPTQIQNRALTLLRSGDVTTFPQLFKQILDDVRKETALESKPLDSSPSKPGTTNGSNGEVQVNGSGSGSKKANGGGPGPGEASNLYRSDPAHSLAVPTAVIEEALKVTREALESVCEIDEAVTNS